VEFIQQHRAHTLAAGIWVGVERTDGGGGGHTRWVQGCAWVWIRMRKGTYQVSGWVLQEGSAGRQTRWGV
jgi:hypothetical protein